MNNNVKHIDIKNRTYYFFVGITNIKDFGANNIKIDKMPCKYILAYYIGYVTINDSQYVKINIANPLYLILNKINRYFEELNEINI